MDLEKAFTCVPQGMKLGWGCSCDRILSLPLVNDVNLLVSMCRDLQFSLEPLAAECDATRMRKSIYKSEAMVLIVKMVDCPPQVA